MSGEPGSFEAAFQEHRLDVRRLCRRMLGNDAAADDAASETFLRAQQARETYDPSRPLRTWLLGIASNHCVDQLRRRSTETRIFEDAGADPGDLSDRGPSPLTQLVRAEERQALLDAIDRLPAKYRVPLVLRHFADHDYQAIADVIGTTKGQVGTLLFRAKRRLREDLGGRR